MSDEQNLILEDDTPEAVPDVSPAASVAPVAAALAPAPPPAADEEIDPNAVDLKDEARVRGLLAELSRQRGVVRDLKPKAERAAALEQEIAQARPYVDFLRSNPDLLKPRPTTPAADPQADPEAMAAAQLYDFYTPKGEPDLVKGAAHVRMVRQEAQRIAQQTIQPYAQQSAQEKSNFNYHAVLQMKDPQGRTPSPEAVTQIWRQILSEPNGLAITADQRAAAFLAMAAFGIDRMTHKAPGDPVPRAGPVLETEASGGHPRSRPAMSATEERIAAQRGIKPEKWQELTKGFVAGRSTILEDD